MKESISHCRFHLQIFFLGSMACVYLVSAGDEEHVSSTYEEKTKQVQIPIYKKYGKITYCIDK